MRFLISEFLHLLQILVFNILKCGPIPSHVGIIMDGNRRYSEKKNIKRAKGYNDGTSKLSEIISVCTNFGIKEVTVYVFSIENFKRTEDEVDYLMDLVRKKIEEQTDLLVAKGTCIRIIGNSKMLDVKLYSSVHRLMQFTKNNTKICINLATAYTSREELTTAIKAVMIAVRNKVVSEVTENSISRNLYTSTEVDMMIRTSGEVRFSDFLLWQSTKALLCFIDVLWPDFSVWNVIFLILHFQKYWFINNVKSW